MPQLGLSLVWWTTVGGDILVSNRHFPKARAVVHYRELGKIMKESSTIAMEYIKANAVV